MDKLLFLDIDGVLNSTQSANYYQKQNKQPYFELCPIAVSNLNYIIEKIPDLKIIISSSWRMGQDLDHLKSVLHEQGVNVSQIIDMTPISFSGHRGHEITLWMEEYTKFVCHVVILDDNDDMGEWKDVLVQTDYRVGLDWLIVERVLESFNIFDKMVNKISRI